MSPRERGLQREFAEELGLDIAYLYRLAHAIANEVAEPEVFSFFIPSR